MVCGLLCSDVPYIPGTENAYTRIMLSISKSPKGSALNLESMNERSRQSVSDPRINDWMEFITTSD